MMRSMNKPSDKSTKAPATESDPGLQPAPPSIDEIIGKIFEGEEPESEQTEHRIAGLMMLLDKELDKFLVDSDVREFRQSTSSVEVDADARQTRFNDCVVAASKDEILIRLRATDEKSSLSAPLILTRALALLLARRLLQGAEITALTAGDRWWLIS